MKALFDYGEFLLCIGPIFLVIAGVGLLLLANSWPKRKSEKPIRKSVEEEDVSKI